MCKSNCLLKFLSFTFNLNYTYRWKFTGIYICMATKYQMETIHGQRLSIIQDILPIHHLLTSMFYRLQVTNSCGTVYSNVVQISTASDFGGSIDFGNPPSSLCSTGNFTVNLLSGSIEGSILGGMVIRYVWQSIKSWIFYFVYCSGKHTFRND